MTGGRGAVHARKSDVHEDHVRLVLLGELDGVLPAPRFQRPVSGESQDVAGELHVLLVVVDDQDQLAGHRSLTPACGSEG